MDFPLSFVNPTKGGKVCRLRKSSYGLKQSSKAWFGIFTRAMKNYGYHQSHFDHNLFLKQVLERKIATRSMCIDNIVEIDNDSEEISKLKT